MAMLQKNFIYINKQCIGLYLLVTICQSMLCNKYPGVGMLGHIIGVFLTPR